MLTRSHIGRLATSVIGCVLLAISAAGPAASYTPSPDDRLPNLRMLPLTDISFDTTTIPGRRLLRFTAVIVNANGQNDNTMLGPFEVEAKRASTAENTMTVAQRVRTVDGSVITFPTSATMQFDVGDGHQHWHIVNLESYELTPPASPGNVLRRGQKTGFCFFDNYRFAATANAVYTSANCGTPSSLQLTTGLTVGWGDAYWYQLANQYVDVTGLAAGKYRLWARADLRNDFRETADSDNYTWVDVQLGNKNGKGNGLTVTGRCPSGECL